ncbi:MAG: hydroxyacid dehydrogenase [Alphaproteobacteria bacterium]
MNAMRLLYFNRPMERTFLDVLEADGGFAIEKRQLADSVADNLEALAETHVYSISSAKDELARELWGEKALFDRCPNILMLSTYGAGYDVCDLDAATAAGVAIVNQAGGNLEGVAEHALAMMLTVAKKLIVADRMVRRGEVTDRDVFKGIELKGKTVGIIGLGHVGGRVAALCKGLFECEVVAFDPYLSAEEMAAKGATKVDSLHALAAASDFVSLNCPLTPETRGMVDASVFDAMRDGTVYVATARGYIHNEDALVAALNSGKLAGAGIDVWDIEPPPTDHPLLAMDNVILSPHTAGITNESRRNIAKIAAEQLIEVRDGKKPPRLLNPAVWPKFQDRFEAVFGIRPVD